MPRRNAFVVPQPRDGHHQYRFWGSRKPPENREPVRAEVVTSDDGEGTAQIRIYDPIDSWGGFWGISAKEFAAALDSLDSRVSTIELHINSPGGEAWEAIAILNLLRQHPADVRAVVDGLAASAASFLAAGADDVVMAPNSQMMIHDAWGICVGPAADMQFMGELLDKVSNNIASIYTEKAGGAVADWRELMLAETWYDAEEAVAAGLADSVLGDAPEADPAPENSFDLSVFKHKGRNEAPSPPPLPETNASRQDADARARRLRLAQRKYPAAS